MSEFSKLKLYLYDLVVVKPVENELLEKLLRRLGIVKVENSTGSEY